MWFSVAPSPDGFHAPALHAAPYGSLRSGEGAVDRILERGGLALEYQARKAAQDHFDAAHLINATPRAVHILHANANARSMEVAYFPSFMPRVCRMYARSS